MKKLMDLTNNIYGSLIVLSFYGRKNNRRLWECLCVCGKNIYVPTTSLTGGNTTSCGCSRKSNRLSKPYRIHGLVPWVNGRSKPHPIYVTWRGMRRRCYDSKSKSYSWYGAKGIKVCDDWLDPKKFYDWAIANGWNKGLVIDREDSTGHYEPNNCRFITQSENVRRANERRDYSKTNFSQRGNPKGNHRKDSY
jgi:hypothetical protein